MLFIGYRCVYTHTHTKFIVLIKSFTSLFLMYLIYGFQKKMLESIVILDTFRSYIVRIIKVYLITLITFIILKCSSSVILISTLNFLLPDISIASILVSIFLFYFFPNHFISTFACFQPACGRE